jgi:hypothetical protein
MRETARRQAGHTERHRQWQALQAELRRAEHTARTFTGGPPGEPPVGAPHLALYLTVVDTGNPG